MQLRAFARRSLLTALLIGSFAVFLIQAITILTPTFVKSRGLAKQRVRRASSNLVWITSYVYSLVKNNFNNQTRNDSSTSCLGNKRITMADMNNESLLDASMKEKAMTL
jgi:hypothetical protein